MSVPGARSVRAGVVAVVVAALAVVMSPLPATAAPPPKPPAAAPAPGADKHGAGSELGDALQKARESRKPVEVVGQRTGSSTTSANPDGTLTMEQTQHPTRKQLKDGSWAPLDTTLAPANGRLAPKTASSKVTIRSAASTSSAPKSPNATAGEPDPSDPVTDDVVTLDPPGAAEITMGFGADLPAPTVAGDTATYALGGGAVLTASALDDGFRADVVLASKPLGEPTYRFPIDVTGGLTPRLKDQTLQFVDTKNEIVAMSAPLQAWDAQRDAGGDPSNMVDLDAQLERTADGWDLNLTAPAGFLDAVSTRYPVVVDPTVTLSDPDDSSNTWYFPGNTTDRTNVYYLSVGTRVAGEDAHRSYLNFNTAPFDGKTVTNATMSLYQYMAGSCSAKQVKIYPTTTASHINGSQVRTEEDSAWSSKPSFNTGGDGGCSNPDAYVPIDVTKTVTTWTSGEWDFSTEPDALGFVYPKQQYGMEVQAGTESDTSFYKRFCAGSAPAGTGHCEGSNGVPKLSVTYVPDLGTQSSYEAFTHKLNDRSQLSVNTRYGNAVVRASDLHVTGRNRDLSIDRFYNSESTQTGQLGYGWTLSVGPDVRLRQATPGNNDRFYYVAPGGTNYGPFVRKTTSGHTNEFYDPAKGGSDADLNQNSSGTYSLKFNKSQEEYVFDEQGCATSCDKVQLSDEDRNDNKITFNYPGGVFSSITDTQGRQFNVNRGSNGLVSSIVEATAAFTPSPRTWAYGYTGTQLTSYTDPTNKTTSYGYTGTLMNLVTDPAQADGKRPTTKLTYANTAGQATQLDYYLNLAGTAFKRFTFAYSSDKTAAKAVCDNEDTDNWFASGTITNASDPQGGTTKYCYKDRDLVLLDRDPDRNDDHAAKQRVFDGLGHRRTISFTPNNDVSTGAGGATDAATKSTTAYKYDVNNNLSEAIQPKDDDVNSTTAGTTSFDYKTDKTSVAGGSFLPSSAATSAASCSSMNYDSKGNLTDTYTGLAATSGKSTCSGSTGGKHSKVKYYDESDGAALKFLPKYSYSAVVGDKADADRTDADYTWYSYTAPMPNVGKLTQVVKPGGNGGNGGATCASTNRTLCTTYTYDGRSRVTTIRDGNNRLTTLSYDANDRTTQVLTNGATSCTPTAGTCVQYTWDGEGNLASRVDVKGTTTFTYDWLNRPATQTQPDGTVLATTFDGAGNLTQHKQTLPGQAGDTVNYTYDAANENTSITDATGSYTYTYDEDARPKKLTLPTVSGVSIAYEYTRSGRLKKITPAGGANLPSYEYSYTDGGVDHQQLQKTTFGGALSGSISYDYDSDDRLKSADPSSGDTWSYEYDADANIKKATLGTTDTYYGYNQSDQLCWKGPNNGTQMGRSCPSTPSGGATYSRDPQGNSLGTTAAPIAYNANNQVSQITNLNGTGGAVSMSYYDQGNDLRVTEGANTLTTGGQLGVTSRRNASGITYYTRDPSGQLLNMHGAGGTYHYLLDRQGSVTTLIATGGSRAGFYTYDPYGKTTPSATTGPVAANPWRYTGGYQDPTDGYYHFNARYYDGAGHFNQADPVAGSLTRPEKYNNYIYAAGDPINNTDLSGSAASAVDYGSGLGGLAGGAIGAAVVAGAGCALSLGLGCAIYGVVALGVFTGVGSYIGSALAGASPEQARDEGVSNGLLGALGGAAGSFAKAAKFYRATRG